MNSTRPGAVVLATALLELDDPRLERAEVRHYPCGPLRRMPRRLPATPWQSLRLICEQVMAAPQEP